MKQGWRTNLVLSFVWPYGQNLLSLSHKKKHFFLSILNSQVFSCHCAYKCFFFFFLNKCAWKWNLKGICLCSWEIQMFSLAHTALFIKPESQGRYCVQLSVIAAHCSFLFAICHSTWLHTSHLKAWVLTSRFYWEEMMQNVHVSIVRMVSKLFQWLLY